MASYINVNDLEKCFEEFSYYYLHNYEDLAPVVHAHWIEHPNSNYSPFDGSVEYDKICSNCGGYHECFYNYCPDCGAEMDEESIRCS